MWIFCLCNVSQPFHAGENFLFAKKMTKRIFFPTPQEVAARTKASTKVEVNFRGRRNDAKTSGQIGGEEWKTNLLKEPTRRGQGGGPTYHGRPPSQWGEGMKRRGERGGGACPRVQRVRHWLRRSRLLGEQLDHTNSGSINRARIRVCKKGL